MSVVRVGRPILDQLEDIDLSTISEKDAKEVLMLVLRFYASSYREPGDTRPKMFAGLYPPDALKKVQTEHMELLVAAGFKDGTMSQPTRDTYIRKGGEWFWQKQDRLSWLKFMENQQIQDRVKEFQEEVMADETASKGVRLKAARDLVSTTNTQLIQLGAVSPQKIEVFPGEKKENLFTADEMAAAAQEVLTFEQQLLGEGENES